MAFRDALDAFKVFRSVPFFASILGPLGCLKRDVCGCFWSILASREFPQKKNEQFIFIWAPELCGCCNRLDQRRKKWHAE